MFGDYNYLFDIVDILQKFARSGTSSTINVVTGCSMSLQEIAGLFKNAQATDIQIVYIFKRY